MRKAIVETPNVFVIIGYLHYLIACFFLCRFEWWFLVYGAKKIL